MSRFPWDKNDTKDAANVADLISQGIRNDYDLPRMPVRELRSLLLLRKRLKKQLYSCRVRISNYLEAQYFTELDKSWNKAEDENLAIVHWFLSPAKIRSLEFEDFFNRVTNRCRASDSIVVYAQFGR